jgi:hypothetical protein
MVFASALVYLVVDCMMVVGCVHQILQYKIESYARLSRSEELQTMTELEQVIQEQNTPTSGQVSTAS